MSDYTISNCTKNNKTKSPEEISPQKCLHMMEYMPTIGLHLYDEEKKAITNELGQDNFNIIPAFTFNSGEVQTTDAAIKPLGRMNDNYGFEISKTGAGTVTVDNKYSIKQNMSEWTTNQSIIPLTSGAISYPIADLGDMKLNNPVSLSAFSFKITKNDSRRLGAAKIIIDNVEQKMDASVTYSQKPQTTRPVSVRLDFNPIHAEIEFKLIFTHPSTTSKWRHTSQVEELYFVDEDGNKLHPLKVDGVANKTINNDEGEVYTFRTRVNTRLKHWILTIGPKDGLHLDLVTGESVGSRMFDPSVPVDQRNILATHSQKTKQVELDYLANLKRVGWTSRGDNTCTFANGVVQTPYYKIPIVKPFSTTSDGFRIDNNVFACVKGSRDRTIEFDFRTTNKVNTIMTFVATGTAEKYKAFNIRLINGQIAMSGHDYDFTFSQCPDLRDGIWHTVTVIVQVYKNRKLYILDINGARIGHIYNKPKYDTVGDFNYIGQSNDEANKNSFYGEMLNIKFYNFAKNNRYYCKGMFRKPWWIKGKTKQIGSSRQDEARYSQLTAREITRTVNLTFLDADNVRLGTMFADITNNPDGNTELRCEAIIPDMMANKVIAKVQVNHHELFSMKDVTINIIPTGGVFNSSNQIKLISDNDSAISNQTMTTSYTMANKILIEPVLLDDPSEATLKITLDKKFHMYQYGQDNANHLSEVYNRNMSENSPSNFMLTDDTDNATEEDATMDTEGFSNKYQSFNSVVEGLTLYDSPMTGGLSKQQTLRQTHANVVKQRSNMDMKMAELNQDKNTIYHENKQRYDRTMFGGIVMSVLGTSLAYYAFTEL